MATEVVSRHPLANRETRLGGARIAYLFKRGKRRTIGFSVSHDGLLERFGVVEPEPVGPGKFKLAGGGFDFGRLAFFDGRSHHLAEVSPPCFDVFYKKFKAI